MDILILGFTYSKSIRLFAMDGCHLHDVLLSTLYVVTGRDANEQNVVLAVGIGGNEDANIWTAFLTFFKKRFIVPTISISDRDKGLSKALRHVFPNVPQTACALHLARNAGATTTVPKKSSLQLSSQAVVVNLAKVKIIHRPFV